MMSDEDSSQRWLIRAKFDAPKHQVHLVERGHLLDRLDQFLERRVGLVVAPAGFGKSTLMAQWRERQVIRGASVAWLSLDEADSEPMQFIAYVILALSKTGLDLGWLVPLAEQGLMDSGIRPAISHLLEAIAEQMTPVVLVLDDYHRVSSPAVDRMVNGIIGAAPHNFTILIASRTRPRLDLSRLMAAGVAAEIDAEPLRLSREDVGKALDRPLDPTALDLLHDKTEGWPVALQLARFLLRSDNDVLSFLEAFRGDSGHIAAYLTEQVLCSLTDEERSFLLRTSVLERFNAPLADATTDREDSLAILTNLEHLNALLVPLGEPRGWFRYHHLFADYLKNQLQRQFGGELRPLHLRASRWYEEQGDLTEAVRHAREADDFERCAALVEQAGGWELILLGGIGHLRNLLKNIPPAVMAEYPRLEVAQAYLHLKDGRLSDARNVYEQARTAGKDPASPELERDFLNIGALLDGYEDRRRPSDLDRLGAMVARHPQSDPMTIGILACEQTLGALAVGRIAEAEVRAQEAMRAMRRARTVLGLNYCYLHAGLVAFYQGRFQVAEAQFGAAQRMAIENFASDPGLKAQSSLLRAVLGHWRGTLTPEDQIAFLTDIEHVEIFDGWFELYAVGLDVECSQHATAAPAIARARRIASERGLRRLELLADAYALRHGLGQGEYGVLHQLRQVLPDGIWRRDPFLWRPFVESRLAIATSLLERNRSAALQAVDEAMECCRTTGAMIYLIDALVLRALVLDRAGERAGALADLIEALSMAAPEGIARPFERMRELVALLRGVIKVSREEYLDVLVINFAKKVLATCAAVTASDIVFEGQEQLSGRERDVFEELAKGHSNKQIARALGMTENTVKSHLKNIFVKLKIDSRAQAITLIRGASASRSVEDLDTAQISH